MTKEHVGGSLTEGSILDGSVSESGSRTEVMSLIGNVSDRFSDLRTNVIDL